MKYYFLQVLVSLIWLIFRNVNDKYLGRKRCEGIQQRKEITYRVTSAKKGKVGKEKMAKWWNLRTKSKMELQRGVPEQK